MKRMQKWLVMLIAVLALGGLVACNDTPSTNDNGESSSAAQSTQSSQQENSSSQNQDGSPTQVSVDVAETRYVSTASYTVENGETSVTVADEVYIDLSEYASQISGEPVEVQDSIWGGRYPIQEGSDNTGIYLSYADFKGYANHDFSILFEENTDGVVTKQTMVNVSVYACTYVIKTAADLDAFGAIAKEMGGGKATAVWDGYFVLGNDIAYNKEFTPFITRKSVVDVVGASGFVESVQYGFKGTFDGQGYTIDGMKMNYSSGWQATNAVGTAYTEPEASGFIGLLNVAGVIKNVAFTNAEVTTSTTQGDGFIAYAANGKMENIYVHLKKVTKNGSGYFGTFVGLDARAGLEMKNSYAHVDTLTGTNTANFYGIGSAHLGRIATGNVSEVYVTGTTSGVRVLSEGALTGDSYGAYATRSKMSAANVAINADNGWDMQYWKVGASGCPVFKTAEQYVQGLEDAEKIVEVQESQTFSAATYTVNDGAISVSISDDVRIDLSEYASQISGEPTLVQDETWGGTYALKTGSDTYGVILSYNDLKANAMHELNILFEERTNGVVTKTTSVFVTVYVYTYVIKTAADLDAFGAIAKEMGGGKSTAVWDGYFVLGNDIAYNKEFTPFITRKSVVDVVGASGFVESVQYGFKGTFDGQGYTIDGMKMNYSSGWQATNAVGTAYTEPEASGFIGLLNVSGVIKNVAFTNAEVTTSTTQGDGFIAYAANGKMENIYVHLKKVTKNGSGYFGTFVGLDARAALNIHYCYAHIDEIVGTNTEKVYGIGSAYTGYLSAGNLKHVYATGTANSVRVLGTSTHTGDIYNAWAQKSDMKAANIAITAENGWNTEFWTVDSEGCPKMKEKQ